MTVVWLKFNSSYEVSNMGEVRSVDRCVIRRDTLAPVIFKGKTLKLGRHRDGYLKLSLSEQNRKKMYFVHRLVALTFIPNPDNLPQVNHIDGNKQNNHYSNLEWCTISENTKHGFRVLNRKPVHSTSIPIKLINIETNEVLYFKEMTEAGVYLGTTVQNIFGYFKREERLGKKAILCKKYRALKL